MSFLSKLRLPEKQAALAAPPMHRPGPNPAPRLARPSNGLKEFTWYLEGVQGGKLLDLGPVWQATVSFFVERGFRVSTEDILRAWKSFLQAEAERLRTLAPDDPAVDSGPQARAGRFLAENLIYPAGSFDAVLAWDVLDYLEPELATRAVARLGEMVKEGGVAFALFHARKPEAFHRYRVSDSQSLEMIPAPPPCPPQRNLQNREILNLFSQFHSAKTFVGRDQIREGVFIR